MKSIIILGKGKSALRCTKDYVLKHDIISACNFPIIKDYPNNFPYKIDWHYRNNDCNNFEKEEFEKLGISKVISTDIRNIANHYLCHYNVEYEYPNIANETYEKHGFYPSTGTQALINCIDIGFEKISMVGFDLFEKGCGGYP